MAAVTSVIALHTIMIIDKIIAIPQARPLPIGSPYAKTHEIIAIATNTAPNEHLALQEKIEVPLKSQKMKEVEGFV
ncbi:MAG: hypothetical protein M3270_00605 [Thermoproteota archaeon]|nr:hypothetical protein [Thermoproteota archaeon]